jgi:hypothetical protein
MGILRPETDTATLGDVLVTLLAIDNGRDLEALLRGIRLDAFNPDERATLLNAIASATARCWTRRWPADCCD